MSECECGSCGPEKTVLIYACSGGANVAEISDHAARELMFAGQGTMFCLAGLGADIQAMVPFPYSRIFATVPAPTVRPPSRIAKRIFSSIATG